MRAADGGSQRFPSIRPAPESRGGYPVWDDRRERPGREGSTGDRVEVLFIGRPGHGGSPEASRREILEAVRPPSRVPELAWVRQVHSARVVRLCGSKEGGAFRAGEAGEADALVADRPDLALSVVTADCVPVLLASRRSGGPVAAIHAGWRGTAGEIVPRALEVLREVGVREAGWTAWLGPAIGPCCYEVGEEVAERVAGVAGAGVVLPNPVPERADRPHLDLRGAVALQLRRSGVGEVRLLGGCTRCSADQLWSYRRQGTEAGRNLAFIWFHP